VNSPVPAALVRRIEALEAAIARRGELSLIGRLRGQYCRYVDAKRWDDLETILTSDYRHFSTNEVGAAPALVAEGTKPFRQRLEALTAGATTVHACFMPELTLIDDTHARGTWSMTDIVSHPSNPDMRFSGRGHYDDEYHRGDDGIWRIAVTRLTRQRLDPLPVREEARPPGLPSIEKSK
jgi:SnoaL-like domain